MQLYSLIMATQSLDLVTVLIDIDSGWSVWTQAELGLWYIFFFLGVYI